MREPDSFDEAARLVVLELAALITAAIALDRADAGSVESDTQDLLTRESARRLVDLIAAALRSAAQP
jgi:hypothetical protein